MATVRVWKSENNLWGSLGSNSGGKDGQRVPLPTDSAMGWAGTLFFFFTIKISYTIQQQQQKHSNGRKWKQSTEIKDTLQFCCFVKSVHVCLDFLFFHLHKGQNPAGTIKLKQSTSSICSWENTIL